MDPIQLSTAAAAALSGAGAAPAPQVPFGDQIQQALATANRELQAAEESGAKLARKEADVVDTMVALGNGVGLLGLLLGG